MQIFKNVLANFNTPVKLQVVDETTVYRGAPQKKYVDSDTFNCSWKGKGGTELEVNGVLVIKDTAEITCWYNPKIKSNSRLINLKTNEIYSVIGEPENVDGLGQYMTFKVENVKGGA